MLPFLAHSYQNRLDHFTMLECDPDTAKMTKEHLVQIILELEEQGKGKTEEEYRSMAAFELLEYLDEELSFNFDSIALINNFNAVRLSAMAEAFGDVLAAGGDSVAMTAWDCYADRIKELADDVIDFEAVDE
jgi:hypothetical protein